jgi:hypothetical protein
VRQKGSWEDAGTRSRSLQVHTAAGLEGRTTMRARVDAADGGGGVKSQVMWEDKERGG